MAGYEAGPDALTQALLDALEPLDGARVLDFACGAGLLSAFLAARGADVVGLDVSPASTARAFELVRTLQLERARFVTGTAVEGTYDRVCGRFALHHTDVAQTAPALAGALAPGGWGAFLETMGPLSRVRRRLTGRLGVPRYGTADEHPLVRSDLRTLRNAFGTLELHAPRVVFLRLLDRQLLRHRSALASKLLGAGDDLLGRTGLGWLSYQQVVVVGRPRAC